MPLHFLHDILELQFSDFPGRCQTLDEAVARYAEKNSTLLSVVISSEVVLKALDILAPLIGFGSKLRDSAVDSCSYVLFCSRHRFTNYMHVA